MGRDQVTRHRFDPVALVLGGLALAAGIVVLAGGSLTDGARVLLPAGLIALGAALLLRVVRRQPRAVPAVPPPPEAASAGFDDDALGDLDRDLAFGSDPSRSTPDPWSL